MAIGPLQRSNFVDQAYGAIKQLIIEGELGPGCQLNIDALARRLGVSNSPIREAVRRLQYERWVEAVPFRGAFVRPLDAAELVELYEFRAIIEMAALRKLMRRAGRTGSRSPTLCEYTKDGAPGAPDCRAGSPTLCEYTKDGTPGATDCGAGSPTLCEYAKDGAPGRAGKTDRGVGSPTLCEYTKDGAPEATGASVLREIVAQIEGAVRAGDAMAYLTADARFHQTIVDLAGNRRLSELFRTLVEQGRGFMLGRTPEAMARCQDGPDEHAELLKHIERGDRRTAGRLLAAHLEISRDELRKLASKGGNKGC